MQPHKAKVLWIESDPLSGGSKSQVEFPIDLGRFFGGSSSPSFGEVLPIRILSAGVLFLTKHMDFHHNSVWRLNLPTQRQGLGPYENTILCFEKTQAPNQFRMTIVAQGSRLAKSLRRETKAKGGKISTTLAAGSREYGFF